MPYAPGITYDTQQIGQGLSSMGQSLGQGIKDYAQNKKLDATVSGQIEAYMQQHAQDGQGLKLSPNSMKLAEKLTQGKATLNDKMQLLGMLQTDGALKKEEQDRKAVELKNMLEQEKVRQSQAQTLGDQQARAHLSQLNQYMGGVGGGVLQPQVQARLAAQAQDPVMAGSAQLYGATGQVPSPETLVQQQGTLGNIARRPVVDPDRIRSVDAKGQPIEITIDKLTGKELGRGPVQRPVLSPDEEGQKEMQIQDARAKTTDAYKVLADVSDGAEVGRDTGASIGRILALYDQGATSGFGQPVLTGAKAVLSRIPGFENVNVGNQQQFEKELNNMVLHGSANLMKGVGRVTTYEIQAVQKASANPNLSPAANKQILTVLKNIADRNVKLDQLRTHLEDTGVPAVDIARQIRRARDAMPVGVESLSDLSVKSIGTTKPPAGWSISK